MAVHTGRRRAHLVVAVLFAGALVASACGSDSTTNSGTTATAATTVAPAATTTAAAGTTSAAPATTAAPSGGDAQARVDEFRKPVTALPFSEPVAAPKGKKIFYVQCSVPVCEEIKTGIEGAATALGWSFESAAHKDTPETVASAFDAAIAAKPDVVLTSGNPREWFASQLKTLEDAKVPVVAWSIPESYEPGNGIAANLLTDDDYYFYGVLMADYAATQSKNKNILFVGLPTFPVLSTVQKGFQDEIKKVCPECKVDTQEVAVTDLGVNLPGQIVSKLQANKDLDFLAYAFGGMLFGVPEALQSAGLIDQAKAVSQAGGPLNFGFIADGQHQEAEVGLASELLGWRAVDVAARVLAGQEPGRATPPAGAKVDGHPDILVNGLPLQILEKDSIQDPAALWPGVEGFQDQFKKLWGV